MERKWGKNILCLMLYIPYMPGLKKVQKTNVHAMQNPTVLHSETPHTEHTALCLHGTTALQRITLISTRERERERKQEERRPIRSTQLRFVSHTKRRRCATVIFRTLKHWDKLALCKISEPGLMEAPRGSMENNLRRHGDKQNAQACSDSHRWIA